MEQNQDTISYCKESYMNCILIGLNILVFLITDFFAVVPAISGLLDQGALSWQAVLEDHQYYRMLTSMFLHDGIDHIFNNMLVLLVIGAYLEKEMGHLSYLILYFSSGILAGCSSMVYNILQESYTISVGASGAIFGVMGGLLMAVLLQRGRGQQLNYRQILFMVAFSLYGGFTSQNVDNAAHVGGFVSGFLLTGLICLLSRVLSQKK